MALCGTLATLVDAIAGDVVPDWTIFLDVWNKLALADVLADINTYGLASSRTGLDTAISNYAMSKGIKLPADLFDRSRNSGQKWTIDQLNTLGGILKELMHAI